MKYDVESVEKNLSRWISRNKNEIESFLKPSWNLDVTFQQSRHNWKKPSGNLKPPFTKILPTIISFSVSQQHTHIHFWHLTSFFLQLSSLICWFWGLWFVGIQQVCVHITLVGKRISLNALTVGGRGLNRGPCTYCGWSWKLCQDFYKDFYKISARISHLNP